MGSVNGRCKPLINQHEGENDLLTLPFSYSKDHAQAMLDRFSQFRRRRQYCDMNFHVKDPITNHDKVYEVHRVVFAACSEYCREKLEENPTSHKGQDDKMSKAISGSGSQQCINYGPISVISDFPLQENTMNLVLDFLYEATFEVKIKELPELFEASHRLKIPTLQRYCEWALQNRYILDLFHPIMKLAEKLDLPEVREFAVLRTLEQFEEFVDTNTFLRLSDKEMQILVDNRRAFISHDVIISEVEMFNAILKWVKHNYRSRQEKGRSILRHLNFQKMPKATLSGYVVTHDLVKGDKQLMGLLLVGCPSFYNTQRHADDEFLDAILEHVGEICIVDKKRVLQRLRERSDIGGQTGEVDGIDPGSGDGVSYPTQPTLLTCGGRLFDQMSAQILLLNNKQNVWQEFSRLPTVLSHHCVAVIGNALYVTGGEDTTIPGTHSIPHFWRYDPPPKNVWTLLADMLHSRSFFVLTTYGENLYAFGGKSGKIVRSSTERYSSASRRWEFCAPLKTPRHAHAGCSFKNMFYVSGGVVGKHSGIEMLRFDPIGNYWTSLAPMSCPRSSHCMSSIRDRIYVVGGVDDTMGLSKSPSIAIECYTPECDQWFNAAHKIPFQSDGDFGWVGYDGLIYLVGGCKSQLAEHRADVWCYDPEEDKWKVQPKLPRRLRGTSCAVMNLRQSI